MAVDRIQFFWGIIFLVVAINFASAEGVIAASLQFILYLAALYFFAKATFDTKEDDDD